MQAGEAGVHEGGGEREKAASVRVAFMASVHCIDVLGRPGLD